jgi:hypothetical protein
MSRTQSGLVSGLGAGLALMLCAAAASAAAQSSTAPPEPAAPAAPTAPKAPLPRSGSPPPASSAPSASPPAARSGENRFAGLSFLLGEWEGRGGGGPGQGSGWFSFSPDLQQMVLVRRNHSDYPAAEGRPAFSHDDLMVIYPQGEGRPLQAIYFDSENHVIRYQVRLEAAGSPGRQAAVFLSDAAPAAPRFRLTYQMTGPDTLDLRFEIAPPDKPDAFAQYISASARRRAATANTTKP